MTVGDIRQMIANLDDDMPVMYFSAIDDKWFSADRLVFTVDSDEETENKPVLFVCD